GATARGSSRIRGLPPGLDVMATARVLAAVAPAASPRLQEWVRQAEPQVGSSGDVNHPSEVRLDGEGWDGLHETGGELDCANSGTTMRLMSGVLAGAPFRSVLAGDQSLRRRPMERVARPLRAMGVEVSTAGGRPLVEIVGGPLRGIEWSIEPPSAQVR